MRTRELRRRPKDDNRFALLILRGGLDLVPRQIKRDHIGAVEPDCVPADRDLAAADPEKAAKVLDAAINQAATARGKIGAYAKNHVQSRLNSTAKAYQELAHADSMIADVDYAAELSRKIREEILSRAAQFTLKAADLFSRVERGEIRGYLCATTVTTVHYLVSCCQSYRGKTCQGSSTKTADAL